jgi:outer membrane receptor for ferric coprogen and ferric-rhodotorulic acid
MKRVNALCGAAALLLLAFSAATAFAQAPLDRTISFDLAAQPLPQALNAFAAQSNLRIVFEAQDAQGFVSERILGSFTPRAVLRMLLESSPLRYDFVDDHTVEIHQRLTRNANSNPEHSAPARPSPQ